MRLTRLQFYFFGLMILILPMIIHKLTWLQRSKVAKAVVIEIYEARRRGNTYPRIQFQTGNGIVTFSGYYNAPYLAGDSLEVRYIPRNPTNCLINTFWTIWIMPIIVAGMIFVIWSFLFLRKIIPPTDFKITSRGIRSIKPQRPGQDH